MSSAAASSILAGKRVVAIEDEGIIQAQLRRILQRAGLILVGIAFDGREGVRTVVREHPDIVLMDIKMPVMDGIEAMRQIYAVYRPCIVMVTAYSDESLEQYTRRIGAAGYVVKPFTGANLIPALEALYREFQEGTNPER